MNIHEYYQEELKLYIKRIIDIVQKRQTLKTSVVFFLIPLPNGEFTEHRISADKYNKLVELYDKFEKAIFEDEKNLHSFCETVEVTTTTGNIT
jgi:hypothetical protein